MDVEALMDLSKEQLVALADLLLEAQFVIGEICVTASKQDISCEQGLREIRKVLCKVDDLIAEKV